MKITADLIPHTEFHKGVWLQRTENPGWYYFMKKSNPNTIKSKEFIKSVDGPLKELVRFLHKKNIKTTPSCAGHHISERNLEKIYNSLEKDAEKIRVCGLELKDVQTGKIYFYKDKDYFLPWNKEIFLEKLHIYQQKGVLGLRLGNRKKIKDQILNLKIKGMTSGEKDSILFIFSNHDLNGENKIIWKQVTKQVKSIFKKS